MSRLVLSAFLVTLLVAGALLFKSLVTLAYGAPVSAGEPEPAEQRLSTPTPTPTPTPAPAPGATPAPAPAGGCSQGSAGGEALVHAAATRGSDTGTTGTGGSGGGDAPPKPDPALTGVSFTMDASTDGLNGKELPVSIEAACGAPKALEPKVEALGGSDGVLVVSSRTAVLLSGKRLPAARATTELGGADTISATVRLLAESRWSSDEDGNQLPTFRATRVDITD
jgi:hypothetical protein